MNFGAVSDQELKELQIDVIFHVTQVLDEWREIGRGDVGQVTRTGVDVGPSVQQQLHELLLP